MSGSQKRLSPANTGHDCALPNHYILPTNFAGSDNPAQITRRSRDSGERKDTPSDLRIRDRNTVCGHAASSM